MIQSFIDIKKTGYDNNIEIDKRIYTSTLFQDGLSIFYFARANTNKDRTEYVPVMMHTDTSMMKIDFSSKRTDIEMVKQIMILHRFILKVIHILKRYSV